MFQFKGIREANVTCLSTQSGSGLRFQGKTELISLKGPKDANQDGPSGASRKGLSKLGHLGFGFTVEGLGKQKTCN